MITTNRPIHLALCAMVTMALWASSTNIGLSQFHAADRNGVVHGLPKNRLQVQTLWEFPLPSSGVGGVGANEELVVVSSRTLNDDADLFYILDPEDGALIFKHQVATQGRLDYGNSPRATPIIGRELVYVLSAFGQLVAIDPAEGNVRWQKHLVQDCSGRMPTWGYCASPLLASDKLIVQPGGLTTQAVAFDSHTGQVIWKTASSHRAGYASPTLFAPDRNSSSVVVGCDEAGLVGWSLAHGHELWRIEPEQSGEFMVPSPIANGQELFWIGESSGLRGYRANSYRANNGAPGKPNLFARNPEVLSDTQTPSLLTRKKFNDTIVLCLDEELVALDPAEQLKVLDRWRHPSIDGYAAVFTEDERALVCCSDGTVLLLALQANKWHKLDEQRPQPYSTKNLAQPAFFEGKLYLRCERRLVCYQLD